MMQATARTLVTQSDTSTNGRMLHVDAFSWFTALFEIAAGVAFGFAGLQLLRGSQR